MEKFVLLTGNIIQIVILSGLIYCLFKLRKNNKTLQEQTTYYSSLLAESNKENESLKSKNHNLSELLKTQTNLINQNNGIKK